MSALRLAVVGCGHLGSIHARKLASREGVELVCVVDPCEEQRARLARETGATPKASLDDIQGNLDAAVVAAPTSAHFAVATRLLQRGCHLLVEKPLAPSGREAAQMCQLARRHQRLLQVGHVERFNPALLAVESQLVEPKYIECRRTSGFSFRSVDIGAVLDLMIHDIDIAIELAGSDVVEVGAFGVAMLGRREDVAQARLRFANGCLADLYASRVSSQRTRTMSVMGEHYLAQIDFAEHTAQIRRSGNAVTQRGFDAERFSHDERTEMGPQYFESLFETEALTAEPCDAIEAEHSHFFEAIHGRTPLRVDGRAGRQAVEVAEKILTAMATHEWDGRPQGRIGPRFESPAPILRPLEWQAGEPGEQRRAG